MKYCRTDDSTYGLSDILYNIEYPFSSSSDETIVADDWLSIVQSSTMLLTDYKIKVADIAKKKKNPVFSSILFRFYFLYCQTQS
jgi:hypothetical protein